jgi:hypothetical protein
MQLAKAIPPDRDPATCRGALDEPQAVIVRQQPTATSVVIL